MAIYLPRLLNPILARLTVARRLATSGDSKSSEPRDSSPIEEYEDEALFEREFVDMKIEDFSELYEKPDISLEEKHSVKEQINQILNQYEHVKYNSIGRVPSSITVGDMSRILAEPPTAGSRDKMFNYYFKRELSRKNSSLKRTKEKEEIQERLSKKFQAMKETFGNEYRTGLATDDGQLIYGLWHNSLFCRIPEAKLRQQGPRSDHIHAALYGKKIIFDFSYEGFMSSHNIRSSVEQVQIAYGLNKFQARDPFDLWFCNYDQNSFSGEFMLKNTLHNLYTNSMITVKNDCFTKHFDKSKLVYLSPDAPSPLTNLNDDDIYIIGVYNDKGRAKPLSLRRAEKLGVRCKKLPLDTYLAWGVGSKSLCINHVFGALLEVSNNGGDWRKAFLKSLPTRKIKSVEALREEESIRSAKYQRSQPFSLRKDVEL